MDRVIAVPLWLGVLLIAALIAIYGFLRMRRRQRMARAASMSANPMASAMLALGSMTWKQFELLVSQAFRQRGYMVGDVNGSTPDSAHDMVLRKNGEYFLVQCKHWRTAQVEISGVRELHNRMRAKNAAGGFLITTGTFTREAMAFASGRKIQLIDGPTLREMLNETGGMPTGVPVTDIPSVITLGANTETPAAPFCPVCNGPMRLLVAAVGAKGSAAKDFWSCARYPACKGNRDAA